MSDSVLRAIQYGGFSGQEIREKTGNFEAQKSALMRGWAERDDPFSFSYVTTASGYAALKEAGLPVPVLLPAMDGWHGIPFEYCAITRVNESGPRLDISAAAKGSLSMHRYYRPSDVRALRDYLTEWLADYAPEEKAE